MSDGAISPLEVEKLRREVSERDAIISALRELSASLAGKNEALERVLINHAAEIELLKRKLFGPKSERTGTSELQLTLGDILADAGALQKKLDELTAKNSEAEETKPQESPPDGAKARAKPKGRRDLSASTLPQVVVELTDPELAAKGKLIGYDESRQLMYARGGFRVLVKKTAKYELPTSEGTTVLGVETPKTLFARSLCHTSVIAWLAVEKFSLGVPHYRLEQHLEAEAESLDRGTMCRYMEELGNVLGATVVNAMLEDARAHCRVLSTDATGAAIQPGPREGGPKRPCKKGHFFTIVADCDHVLFEYTSEHSSAAVSLLFNGFDGFLQADASSVYDILERGPPREDERAISLVGCWAHCRRYFFDAAVCKYAVGLEGLKRIRAIYRADRTLRDLPPQKKKAQRLLVVLPLVDDFFVWGRSMRHSEQGRNLATKALGYATNQEQELRRVFLDGRLPLDNTRSERALRKIVVGRKNWLFYGSDLHAEAAAAIFSIIASCRLHRLDALNYLQDVLRLLPHWPKDRYIELSPLRWAATRPRLDAAELERHVGAITVPAPI
jgi:transposase